MFGPIDILGDKKNLPIINLKIYSKISIKLLSLKKSKCVAWHRPGVGKLFCKGPDSKYSQVCGPNALCCNCSALSLPWESSLWQQENQWAQLCQNKTWFTKPGWKTDLAHVFSFPTTDVDYQSIIWNFHVEDGINITKWQKQTNSSPWKMLQGKTMDYRCDLVLLWVVL